MARTRALALSRALCLLVVAASSVCVVVSSDSADHSFSDGEGVTLWANKVGPYHNPSETYPFYSIPGCPQLRNRPLQTQPDSLSVLLEGDTLTDTGISFPFKIEQQFQRLCDLALDSQAVVDQLTFVAKNHYWYHMLLDDLPLFGMVGEYITEEEMRSELAEMAKAKAAGADIEVPTTPPAAQGFIYTHRDFAITYNGRQIIEVNLTSENPRPLKVGETLPMTYSVRWQATEQPFESRFDRYLDYDFMEHSIHWFSLFNSFAMVVFLCGLVLLILNRTIKTSLSNVAFLDAEAGSASYRAVPGSPNSSDSMGGEETGWKLLVGDVFRAPSHLLAYSVLLGVGIQLFLLVLAVLVLALVVTYYDEERGLLTTLFLFFYSLTSAASGAVSGWYYKLNGGLKWKQTMAAVICFYPALLLSVFVVLEVVSISFGSHGVLSFGTTVMVALVWACISVPLTVAGTLLARSRTIAGAFPCRVNAIRRLIPSEHSGPDAPAIHPNSTVHAWFSQPALLVAMAGVLPFGSVFIELYFAMTSFWHAKYTYMYGLTFAVFVILAVVTVCVAIVSTYILLQAEDYRWHWLAFAASCSSSVYVALYSVYYFFAKTQMAGFIQVVHYFATVAVAVVTLALLTGSIGALGVRFFITKIYSYTKAD